MIFSAARIARASKLDAGAMRALARSSLPRFVFDYLEGGADEELCLSRNSLALERLLLIPERLTDVGTTQCRTDFFSRAAALPLAIAPTGCNALFWPKGDLALARAAAQCGIPFILSSAANSTIEEVSRIPGLDRWFQLYVFHDQALAESLMRRAQDAGYRVLLLTVDMPVSGNRLRDIRNGFQRDFSYRRAALDIIRRPRWTCRMLRSGKPTLANLVTDDLSPTLVAQARRLLANGSMDRSLTWRSIEWIRKHWSGPIVLKGLLNPSDAERARSLGVAGIVLSNHGGRQLDCAPAAIEMLHETARRVRDDMTVLVDGGFGRGSDIVKALALGAHGVLLGRAALYGLAVDGERGVCSVLRRLKEELERTLTLLGIARIENLRPHHVLVEHRLAALAIDDASDPNSPGNAGVAT